MATTTTEAATEVLATVAKLVVVNRDPSRDASAVDEVDPVAGERVAAAVAAEAWERVRGMPRLLQQPPPLLTRESVDRGVSQPSDGSPCCLVSPPSYGFTIQLATKALYDEMALAAAPTALRAAGASCRTSETASATLCGLSTSQR